MTYAFLDKPQENNADLLVATALNGEVYTENKRLHIKNNNCHYVYKFDGSPVGCYARNTKTNDDIFLGVGASPSIVFENLKIKNNACWLGVIKPEKDENLKVED